jgi:hypothetical protein
VLSDLSEPETCSPTANSCRHLGVERRRASFWPGERENVGRAREQRGHWRALSLVGVCLTVSGLSLVIGATVTAAAPAAPYTDPNVVGYIGLCNQAGQQITSGSVSAAPFVWRAVSSQAAPAPYDGAGGTAILNAYLPMQSLAPGDWSGEQLTASTRYSNPQSPMAQATARDVSLQVFVQDYPPEWDGFIQLRLFLGVQNQPADVQHYAALDLQISGDTWTAVGGGPVNCNAGTAESLETVLAPPSTTTTVAASGVVTKGDTSTPVASAAPPGKQAAPASHTPGTSDHLAADQPGRWSHSAGPYVVLAILLALIVPSAFIVARRRRAHRMSTLASQTSVKGPPQ